MTTLQAAKQVLQFWQLPQREAHPTPVVVQPEPEVRPNAQGAQPIAPRPTTWDEYIGQPQAKALLQTSVASAKARGVALGHVLLWGPPGTGKTSLAEVVAHDLGAPLVQCVASVISDAKSLATVLQGLAPGAVLFVDEIHRLDAQAGELLHTAMEDGFLDVAGEGGPRKVALPPFTLVGATTLPALLTKALRDRFQTEVELEWYRPEDLAMILLRAAVKEAIVLHIEAAVEIALRARRTPRIAIRLLRWARDFAFATGDGTVTREAAAGALDVLKIDANGLNTTDRRLLAALASGPRGLKPLSALLGCDADTVEQLVEPYLLQLGLIEPSSRGRRLTDAGRAYLDTN